MWKRIWRWGKDSADQMSSPPQHKARIGQGGETPLERLFSPEALARAWLQVRANGGGPGVDGVTIRTFEADLEKQLESLRQELIAGTYRPCPVRRVLVPKPREGLRPLAIWTLRDRVAQRVVHDYLSPLLEGEFLECSFGFRPGRGVAEAVQAVLAHRDEGYRWVLDADIRDCFDSMDRRLLMVSLQGRVQHRGLLRLTEAWLKARVMNALPGHSGEAGASQGGILSPLLCNLYLHPFDVALTRQGYRLVRYADDLLVLCRRKREAEQAGQVARAALHKLRLRLNPYKTQVVHFDQGFKFLGVFFLRNEHFYLEP